MNILILGGILEARQACQQLYDTSEHYLTYSLAGRTASPILPDAQQHRFGGFGGVDGLCDYIKQHDIDVILDITHPFATQISQHAHDAALQCAISYIGYDRPAYQQQQGDIWYEYSDDDSAVAFLQSSSYRHIMLVGAQQALLYCQKLTHQKITMRAILEPSETLKTYQNLYYMPAHINMAEAQEKEVVMQYIADHDIDIIVMKNSGSKNSNLARPTIINIAKLKKIPIMMIARSRQYHQMFDNMDDIFTNIKALAI